MSFIDDIYDRGAKLPPNTGRAKTLALIVSTIVANGLPLLSPVQKILIAYPAANRLLRLSFPLVFLAGCLYVIRSKRSVNAIGYVAGPATEYSFNRSARLAAKVLCIPLIAMGLFELRANAPNQFGETILSGYVCQRGISKGRPSSVVSALDRFGETVSKEPQSPDDTGYIVLELKPWAPVPSTLSIEGSCPGRIALSESELSALGCTDATPPSGREMSKTWRLTCR
jgi:hypothetical protein